MYNFVLIVLIINLVHYARLYLCKKFLTSSNAKGKQSFELVETMVLFLRLSTLYAVLTLYCYSSDPAPISVKFFLFPYEIDLCLMLIFIVSFWGWVCFAKVQWQSSWAIGGSRLFENYVCSCTSFSFQFQY